jgi:hypothetical protein
VLTVNSTGVAYVVYGLATSAESNATGSLVPVALLAPTMKNKNNSPKLQGSALAGNQISNHLKMERKDRKLDLSAIDTARSYVVGMVNVSGSTTSNLFGPIGASTTPAPIVFSAWRPDNNVVGDLYDKVRLVSAGVAVNYTGVLTTATGTTTVGFLPRASYLRQAVTDGTAVSIEAIQTIPGARVLPNNDLVGGTVFYRPQDNKSLEYTSESIVYDDLTVTSPDAFPQEAMGGEIYVVVTGAPAGATVQITSIFNYEGIPVTSNFDLVSTTPSLSDPISLSHALNTIQTAPTSVGSTSEAQGLVGGKTQIKPSGSLTASSIHNTDSGDTRRFKSTVSSDKTMFERLGDMALGLVEKGANSFIDKIPSLLMGLF